MICFQCHCRCAYLTPSERYRYKIGTKYFCSDSCFLDYKRKHTYKPATFADKLNTIQKDYNHSLKMIGIKAHISESRMEALYNDAQPTDEEIIQIASVYGYSRDFLTSKKI